MRNQTIVSMGQVRAEPVIRRPWLLSWLFLSLVLAVGCGEFDESLGVGPGTEDAFSELQREAFENAEVGSAEQGLAREGKVSGLVDGQSPDFIISDALAELTGELPLTLRTAFISQTTAEAFFPLMTDRSKATMRGLHQLIEGAHLRWKDLPALADHLPGILGAEYGPLSTDILLTLLAVTAGENIAGSIPGWVKVILRSQKVNVMGLYLTWLYKQHEAGKRFAKTCAERWTLYKLMMQAACEVPNAETPKQCHYSIREGDLGATLSCDCPPGVPTPSGVGPDQMSWKHTWNHRGFENYVGKRSVCGSN